MRQIDRLGGRAVVCDGALSGVVVAIVAGAGNGRMRRVCRGKAVGIGRAPAGTLGAVDIPRGDIRLAQGNHAPTGVEGVTEAVALGLGI